MRSPTPNVYYHEASCDRRLRRTLRAEAAAYARRSSPLRTLRSHDCQRASRKLSVHVVVLCASCTPLHCPGALRPRKAHSRLTSRCRVTSFCRRVDLVCFYARRPRRTRRSHERQRASRKLSAHVVVLCASCTPLYCPGAMRPRKACSRLTSSFRVAFYCRRVDLECVYARRPRRTRRSHDFQRASRKLSEHAVVLCASCTPLYCPGAMRPRKACSRLTSRFWVAFYCRRVERRRQELRRQRCTARRIGCCDKHCDDNDAHHDRASHGRRGRDVRYARTIINVRHVS
jgi:hypothetical protein